MIPLGGAARTNESDSISDVNGAVIPVNFKVIRG
jgi:hypothetical protein